MNHIGQGNMYSRPSHTLKSHATSIIKILTSRSLTGRGFGIDIHKHISTQLRLYWTKDGATGCYTRCLLQTQLECKEYDLILDYLV